ncbi:FAD-dependent oxidoreductase [Streptomyces solisilvae]|uniref:FAD-dependent oxidoreductase n=1 Tax=Streptomyces malaysiensis TaxID=92644 RepID=UPI00367A52CB
MALKALIIGGGAGGTTLALALHRIGVEAVVYERDSDSAAYEGHLLSLGSNGLDALRALDVELDGAPIPRLPMYSGSGKRIGTLYNNAASETAPTSLLICRGTLERTLRELCAERGVRIEYGKELASCTVGDEGATAVFTDGTTAEGDVIVGADGAHSRVRRSLFPQSADASYTGVLGLGGRSLPGAVEPTPGECVTSFGYEGHFSYHVEADRGVQWLVFAPRQEPAGPDDDTTEKEWKEWLLDVYGRDMPAVREIITNATGPIDIRPMERLPKPPARYRGRGVLIGDACAITGRIGAGTALAMEDAVVLAQCLRDIDSPERAFATYQELRTPRVDKVVKWGEMNAKPVKVRTPWGMHLRDLFGPLLMKWMPSLVSMDWLYGHHIDWQQTVRPKD